MSNRNAAFSVTLVAALRRLGVEHACVTPGSRNTPLSLALADSAITDWSHHDERSSAFFALGIARTTGRPVLIVTTSGTAAAELHPALAEAIEGRVPLIAITADRPLRLRGVGAPQTIDQEDLFGPSVKWSLDVEAPGDASTASPLATRLWEAATQPPAGPVHLNLRFDEPLMPAGKASAAASELTAATPTADAGPDAAQVRAAAALLSGRRGVIVAGPDHDPAVPPAAAALAAALGWPILADPLSGVRAGSHDLGAVLGASDALGWSGFLEAGGIEAVVRFGAIPTSKPVAEWLAAHGDRPQVFIEPAGRRDPAGTANPILRTGVAATLTALAGQVTTPAPADWLARWRRADAAAAAAIDTVLQAASFPNEPAIARVVSAALPDPAVLWVASSMPVRDLDAVMTPTPRRVRVMANRGANGIDGFISTALGSAAVSGVPTVALAGDLSVLHDVGALATMARLGIPLTVVVVNNDGGGIFHLLPQAGHPHFERHWGTPHGLEFAAIAAAFGVPAERVTTADRLAALLGQGGPQLMDVRTNRAENAELHREIRRRVAEAVAAST
ncbi:MAG: 2-succinyl-5-enolpyruvyl-6-hydroxy-3-cyclohexene-1-carboxylic-acid synthase [Acidimicrobiia bacterium]|nr:2-succinyl-5-enolpyruvyl-6-hydroxy-3-cyclohexene-1-carboxylic-acid synthase [Acidimicrobiia bacterium]